MFNNSAHTWRVLSMYMYVRRHDVFAVHHLFCHISAKIGLVITNHVWVFCIVSITKFSIVIASPWIHLSWNQHAITWVSNYRHPIWTVCNWIPVIEYSPDFHINFAHLLVFFRNVSYSFRNLWKVYLWNFPKTFLITKFIIGTINW